MDEACLNVGKVTDAVLLQEMDSKLKGHKHYSSRRYRYKLDFQLLSLGGGEDSQGSFVPNFLHRVSNWNSSSVWTLHVVKRPYWSSQFMWPNNFPKLSIKIRDSDLWISLSFPRNPSRHRLSRIKNSMSLILLLLRLEPTNKMLAHEENFIIKHYAGDVVYTITGKLRR